MEFFTLLNSLHPSLRFTCEESGSTLPFLDVEVQLSDRGCETWVYRKCTNTDTLLHFDAVAPVRWKSGLVKCMINRAQRLSSSALHFQNEVVNSNPFLPKMPTQCSSLIKFITGLSKALTETLQLVLLKMTTNTTSKFHLWENLL